MRRDLVAILAAVGVVCATAGCKDLTNATLPAGTANPSAYNNAAGAVSMRNNTVSAFAKSFPAYVVSSGILTDEYHAINIGLYRSCDTRILVTGMECDTQIGVPYTMLQGVRNNAHLAIAALNTYLPDSSAAMRGELYAVAGYTELLMADFFCSGVPLSTLDYQGDFTYAPGSTTVQLYRAAIAQFDSAAAIAHDSASIVSFAHVGKGRALLALGVYDSAALAVAGVPTDFKYRVVAKVGGLESFDNSPYIFSSDITLADSEGVNGIRFVTDNDPRSGYVPASGTSLQRINPTKYNALGYSELTVADGIEARLIEAEVTLRSGNAAAWLDDLNALRTTCTDVIGCPTPAPAGSGGIGGLPPLSDPGANGRLDLMFSERAYWLFLTGHRQGDLRRRIREDGLTDAQLYPTGLYSQVVAPADVRPPIFYGSDVAVPIPPTELANPLFRGCINHDA